ncbi:hypothetical protein CAI21_04295 [Alkalilimnicola ehrlichii]|uniref:Flagellar protein FlgJ N-terminal domain-containing protein n=1 Tax=Alkalilimnicola ehrlichii TaxID=351052 RepID=A0A3E0WZ51_9GAMM|nr:rod-binding protein [Alkalilimnicola ehrlichii]RFA30734.1 hypothetical protein CAI21_04295 [Alkalilimnicola ehrlichii]RFA38310.1 hypothetical protein CAL65_05660 [Alkalilimnicola ehrlichii]
MSIVFLSQPPSRLANNETGNDKNSPREQLEAVSEQFEALFLQQILKQMRKAGEALASDDSMRRREMDAFYEMHDQVLAESLASQRQLGIAQMLVDQLGGRLEAAEQAINNNPLSESKQQPNNEFNSGADAVALQDKKHSAVTTHPSAAFAQPIRIEPKDS